jgi:hypothetical protein
VLKEFLGNYLSMVLGFVKSAWASREARLWRDQGKAASPAGCLATDSLWYGFDVMSWLASECYASLPAKPLLAVLSVQPVDGTR